MGKTPLVRAVVVTPGAHEVKVEKTGMITETRSVAPIAGQKVRIVVKLSAVPAPEPAKPAVVATRPSPSDTPPARRVATTDPDATRPAEIPSSPTETPAGDAPSSGRPWQYNAMWLSAGLGVLALAGGVTAQVLWSQKNAAFNSLKNSMGGDQCTTDQSDFGGGPCQSLHQAATLRLTLAIAGYATAGAAAIAAVVFYLNAPSATEGHAPGNSVSMGCLPTASSLSGSSSGLSCALTTRF